MGKKVRKIIFWLFLILLPISYVIFGWYIGLNYSRKHFEFGPYPVIIGIFRVGDNLHADAMPEERVLKEQEQIKRTGKQWFNDDYYINGKAVFQFPSTREYTFPSEWWGNKQPKWKKAFSFTYASSYLGGPVLEKNAKTGYHQLAWWNTDEIIIHLAKCGALEAIKIMEPYLLPIDIEKKYPWLYGDNVFEKKEIFNEVRNLDFSGLSYFSDILGVAGILILFVAMAVRSTNLWLYYLFWVICVWLGRIGWHSSNLAFFAVGWEIISKSFWHGFIIGQSRVCILTAAIWSLPFMAHRIYVYLTRRNRPRKEMESVYLQ